jgi:hypothetical protein
MPGMPKKTEYMKDWIFKRFRKIAKNDYLLHRVCLYIGMKQLGSQWTNFHESLYLSIFRKSVEKIQVH